MSKINYFFLIILLLLSACSLSEKSAGLNEIQLDETLRVYNDSFSFIPPKDWDVEIDEEDDTEIYFAPIAEENYYPNVRIYNSDYAGSLESYLWLNIRSSKETFGNDITFVEKNFETYQGLKGATLIFEVDYEDFRIIVHQYFIKNPDPKNGLILEALYFRNAEGRGQYDQFANEMIKSIQFSD